MVITYNGLGFLRLQLGDTVIALNPIGKDSSAQASRFGADIALVCANHPDLNGVDTVALGSRQPFVISGPGEYEIKGIFIKGIETWSHYPKGSESEDGKLLNTVYTITWDGMRLSMLGVLDSATLPPAVYEGASDADILFVPVGEGVLTAAEANKAAVALSPKIIVPMVFGGSGKDGAAGYLKKFLDESGSEKVPPVDKLTVKKKDIEGKEGEIVVLAQGN